MNFKLFWIIGLFFTQLSFCYAQCQGFHKTSRCLEKHSTDFKQYGQARSAAVEVGKKYKSQIVLYGQKDYIISVCTEVGYKSIHFKVFDKTNNKLIYDNEEDNYNSGVAFSMESTANVEIEAQIVSEREEGVDPESYRVCMGIQILWRRIPRMGFEK